MYWTTDQNDIASIFDFSNTPITENKILNATVGTSANYEISEMVVKADGLIYEFVGVKSWRWNILIEVVVKVIITFIVNLWRDFLWKRDTNLEEKKKIKNQHHY